MLGRYTFLLNSTYVLLFIRKMYVGALHMATTEKTLVDYFSRWGEVSSCQVKTKLLRKQVSYISLHKLSESGIMLYDLLANW